jgi:hypothetical protein
MIQLNACPFPAVLLEPRHATIKDVSPSDGGGSAWRRGFCGLIMFSVQTFGDLVTVRARLTGEFPGSPVELDHIFKLSGNKIASLEIRS